MGCDLSTQSNMMDHKSDILDIIEGAPMTTMDLHVQSGSKLLVNKARTSKLRREKVVLKLRSDPTMSPEIKYFSSPPCSDFSNVTDFVYLTSYSGITEENITNHEVKLIVNVTFETPLVDNFEVTSLRVPIDDVLEENIYPYFELVVPIVEKVIEKKYAVVFHCLVGKSRSATMVLAYLIKAKSMSLDEAFKHLYKVRRIVHPNIAFMKALMKWEKDVHGANSIELIEIDFSGVKLEIPDILIRNYPKVYTSEVMSQLAYFGYDRAARERLIKTGVQKTRSLLKLPNISSADLSAFVSDHDGQLFYRKFSSLVHRLDSSRSLSLQNQTPV